MQVVDGEFIIHPSIGAKAHNDARDSFELFQEYCTFSLNTTKGFILVPLARAVRMTVKWDFSCPVDFSGTECSPLSATVVSEGVSIQHAVSSMAVMLSCI